jgi:ABC-type antimicrobial peptide transport system permease subunit
LSQAGQNGIKSVISSGGDPGFIAFADPAQNDPAQATISYRDASLVAAYAAGSITRAIPFYNGRSYPITVSGKRDYVDVSSIYAMKEGDGIEMLSGRRIGADDVANAAAVGILSKQAAEKLFGSADAAEGRSFNVGSQHITCIGVFVVTGSLFNSTVGDSLYVPYTTMHRIAPGTVDMLQFWAAPGTRAVDAIAAVRAALARVHPRGQYLVQDQSASIGIFENVLGAIGIGLTAIGGLALLVAGVGIMNIMLVSVTERTREIGIRKSIGASAGDISLQFLIEAILLSAFGGVIGTILGVAIVNAAKGFIAQSVGAAPVPWAMVIAVAAGFSASSSVRCRRPGLHRSIPSRRFARDSVYRRSAFRAARESRTIGTNGHRFGHRRYGHRRHSSLRCRHVRRRQRRLQRHEREHVLRAAENDPGQ